MSGPFRRSTPRGQFADGLERSKGQKSARQLIECPGNRALLSPEPIL